MTLDLPTASGLESRQLVAFGVYSFAGYESIAYTTHSDATFLENLIPLTERWRGPVSIAIYVPGSDYDLALQEIAYYRVCHEKSQLIQDYVTFHLYAEIKYANQLDINSWPEVDCEKWTSAADSVTFKQANNLTYPVNVGRNIARESALTHFVLVSDIELYPNPGLIQSFLKMIKNTNQEGHIYNVFDSNPKAYVVSIFEIEEEHELPQTKNELINLMDQETLIPFHQRYCKSCHQIPGAEDWRKLSDQGNEIGSESKVSAIGKRTGQYRSWEPIFIGTHSDPLYDERLSWEGRSDKMTHALQMCLMDYEFHVLDNAFLIHKPGIKTPSNNPTKPDQTIVKNQNPIKQSDQT